MTSEQMELASLRREIAWLMQSEAVRSMSEKDENGSHKYNIKGLDNCIQTLHSRARKAETRLKEVETEAQLLRAENLNLRRQIEAIADSTPSSGSLTEGAVSGVSRPPLTEGVSTSTDDERRFPLYG